MVPLSSPSGRSAPEAVGRSLPQRGPALFPALAFPLVCGAVPLVQIGGGGRRSGLGRAGAGAGQGSVPPPHPAVPGAAPWARIPPGQAQPPPLPLPSRALLASPEIPGTARRFANASAWRFPRYLPLLPAEWCSPSREQLGLGAPHPRAPSAPGLPCIRSRSCCRAAALRQAVPWGCPVPPQLPGAVHCGRAVGGVVVPPGAVTVAKLTGSRTGEGFRLQWLRQNCLPWKL